MSAIEELLKNLESSGHDADADAFEIVDFYMREWVTTADPLSEGAVRLQGLLKEVLKSWGGDL